MKTLQEKNLEVKALQKAYVQKKIELKELESTIYLFGDEQVKEALGKEKVSQKDKEHFVQLKTLKLEAEVENAYLEYKYAQEAYKLLKLQFRVEHFGEEAL